MTPIPHKGPTAYKTLDEYLEARISDEMKEHLKKIDAYHKEHAPAYMSENSLKEFKVRSSNFKNRVEYYVRGRIICG